MDIGSILLTIRSVDRAPRKNYLDATLRSLVERGVDPASIHVVLGDPEIRWLPAVAWSHAVLHFASRRFTANENGLRQIDLLEQHDAEWILLTEDDLAWCDRPLASVRAWLAAHATPDRLVYRFFTFGPMLRVSAHAAEAPLKEQKGSQAVALRAADARRFAAWARRVGPNWRPKGAPFQDRPHDGFDKLIGYWALHDNPRTTTGLVSRPFFVRHLGVESSIHSHGLRRDDLFAGERWSYPPGEIA